MVRSRAETKPESGIGRRRRHAMIYEQQIHRLYGASMRRGYHGMRAADEIC
jgi:hypothetical protein